MKAVLLFLRAMLIAKAHLAIASLAMRQKLAVFSVVACFDVCPISWYNCRMGALERAGLVTSDITHEP